MVQPATLSDRVTKFGFLLLEHEIAIDARPHRVHRLARDRYQISWAEDVTTAAAFIPNGEHAIAGYLELLRGNRYSYLLNDGGIIQISIELTRGQVSKHRLAYYPCPFDLGADMADAVEYGLADFIEDIYIPEASERVRMRSSLRFDYDPTAAADYHPAAHLTLINPECRIPIKSPVLFENFIKFIFENFYFLSWSTCRAFKNLSFSEIEDCASRHDLSRMHLAWVR